MAGSEDGAAQIDELAHQVLGIALRPAQRSALLALTGGRDTLAVLPTGSGKSAIYQVAGLLLGGLTVVISPLIALQRDQLRALAARQSANGQPVRVALLNSAQHKLERAEAIDGLRSGALEFLLLGPEQLANAETHRELQASPRPVRLIAIDEAHLVAEWGHDFRPEYLRLADTIDALGHPLVLALTATAAPPVQAEITRELRMRQPALVVADFDRPNITLAVRRAHVGMAEDRAIVDRAVELALEFPTPTLVYAVSHARCEELAERLGRVALRAAAYHAGLSAAVRARVQDDFFNSRLDVVVATSAFGMGIDKPDVRTVIHAGVPGSLDEYYQEIGRAGRDGQPANAVLVYDPRSLRIPKLFAARTAIRDADVAAVVQALLAHPGRQSLAELTAASRVAGHTAQRLTEELRELGLITLDERGVTARSGLRSTTGPNAVERIEDAGRRRLAILGSRIDSVRHYAETVRCRRAELLAYFGEALTPPCGNCDNDAVLGRRPAAAPRPAAEPVKAQLGPDGPAREPSARDPSPERITVGMTVRHRLWGTGTLLSADEHELVVAFGAVGYRHLTPLALTNGLLTPA